MREKKLDGNKVSLYLDTYHNKKRWYEFLDIHITKSRPSPEDKEKRRLANEIKIRRENELIMQDNGLWDKAKRKADFVHWLEKYYKDRNLNNPHNIATVAYLKKFLGEQPLPFNAVTVEWIMEFTRYLLKSLSNNSANQYLGNLSTALEDAVRQEIIVQNPFRKIPRHERLKRKPVFRNAFTLEELQLLIDTPYKIPAQHKEAYLFSCFTGLRWSDVNPLRWSEIIRKNIDGKTEWFIYFEQEKTEDIEYLPLSDQAIAILQEREQEQKDNREISPYVFPLIFERDRSKGIMGKMVNYYLKKWAVAAGFEATRMHFHTARHTFATNVLEHCPDGDIWTVSKLLGHKSIAATQIYTHVRDSKKKAAIKALPTLRAATKAS